MLDKDALRRLLPLLTLLLLGSIAPRADAAEPAASPQHYSSLTDRAHPFARPAAYEYPIKTGDTLWNIAAAHGIALQELMAANPGRDSTALRVGQIILVPAPPPEAAEPGARQKARPATYEYPIKAGDTLWGIAVAHEITLEDLMGANPGLDSTALRIGQIILVPASPPQPQPPQPPPPEPEVATPAAEAAQPESAQETPSPNAEAQPPAAEPTSPPAPDVAPEMIAMLSVMNTERTAEGCLSWSGRTRWRKPRRPTRMTARAAIEAATPVLTVQSCANGWRVWGMRPETRLKTGRTRGRHRRRS